MAPVDARGVVKQIRETISRNGREPTDYDRAWAAFLRGELSRWELEQITLRLLGAPRTEARRLHNLVCASVLHNASEDTTPASADTVRWMRFPPQFDDLLFVDLSAENERALRMQLPSQQRYEQQHAGRKRRRMRRFGLHMHDVAHFSDTDSCDSCDDSDEVVDTVANNAVVAREVAVSKSARALLRHALRHYRRLCECASSLADTSTSSHTAQSTDTT
ncbi:MAG: hypothetical protein MHM6MM_005939 [Cercozoa sp. M6MM]